ncbi:hypothetical protein [Sediminibacterium ginsengisoli]|uniref:SUKH-4 immunity protein n=1 Tax=Sediminibacterium ginsengisoli TaxID=413434 RepID=A0A1T4PP92_9BACT|nr:hypothetical protein [Sediminibacterium ginsengisoli]SJZ93259.1 hypothetical protein SAMN04488132_106136 [Sediminibacterium ginsengisoli]
MEASLFVEKLKMLAPLKEEFKGLDMPDDFIEQLISSYNCTLKTNDNLVFLKDPILTLLNSYDCSNLEIGIIKFYNNPIENVDYYKIGNVDADILILEKLTLKIVVLDYANLDHIIWECASNSANFLEALLVCSECLTSKLKSISAEIPYSITSAYINRCAIAAGGEQYIDFYKMLLE